MTKKILFFFFGYLILFLASARSTSASFLFFSEDFNGTSLNSNIWEGFNNGGQININSGFIELSSTPGNNFPYIRSKIDPFPNEGDFILEFRVQFPSITAWGVGFLAGTESPSNGIKYDDLIPSRIFTYHTDDFHSQYFWFRFFQENIFNSLAPVDHNFHKISMEFRQGKYKYFFDDKEIIERSSNIRPHAIFFGSPHNQKQLNETTPWTSIKIDYIKIISYSPSMNSPIIFIPGHGGSWNMEDILFNTTGHEWGPTVFFHDQVYGYLLNTLRNSGYREDNGLLNEFFYDWRRPTNESSDKLEAYIDRVLEGKPNGTKVKILGHSFGGLIARNYLQRYPGRHSGVSPPVEQILTVGSPHEGAVESYAAWEGGEIWRDSFLQRIAFEIFITLHQAKYLTRLDTVRNIAPSTLDLFPIFDFLKKTNGELKPNSNMVIQNFWGKNLKDWLNNNSSFTTYLSTFKGKGKQTLEYLKVTDRNWLEKLLDKWPDGKPIAKEKTDQGDGTVLLKSSGITGVSSSEKSLDHIELVQKPEGISEIFNRLNLGNPIFSGTQKPHFNSFLVFLLHSPVVLRVTDKLNRKIGFEVLDNFIPYSEKDEENKMIVIPDPSYSNYNIEIIGQDKGHYKLMSWYFTEDNESFNEIAGNADTDSLDSYLISVNPDSLLSTPNFNGADYLKQAKIKLVNMQDFIKSSNFPEKVKTDLNKKISGGIKNIDGTIFLFNKGDYKMTETAIEGDITYVFGLRSDFRGKIKTKNELYFEGQARLLDVLLTLKDAYGVLNLNLSQTKAKNQISFAKRLMQSTEKKLSISKQNSNSKEAGKIFLEGSIILDQANNDISLDFYRKAYIEGFIAKLLFAETASL